MTRLAYGAKDGTPRNVPIAFTGNGSHIVMCTTKNAPELALGASPSQTPVRGISRASDVSRWRVP
ncbi:hypothetical protein Sliba_78920 [Streptomyces nigrescens]|uniref:Uncharacterized protein n=1 Tax=Streptomyces nigrescens TaxID=1920 RepID=A0A640TVN1_STRNI|nr:hypothetical protein Sliba_78920 [Streptomyces libani subsp. libani]GGV96138.1 hypothetical protein GCM10010500_38150 [Streptomyces libani subsp. libani]